MINNDRSLRLLNDSAKSLEVASEIASKFIEKLGKTPLLQNPWVDWTKDHQKLRDQVYEKRNLKLSGLIIGVKDIFATQDFPTKMGAEKAWTNQNMGFDARIIAVAKEFGAVVGGKTKTSEFAVHKETDVINPKFPEFTAGTSSSGSAAAVANGTVDIALATQTAGSIARPASYCGIFGFKPTFGDLPRTGVLKTTDEFDTIGVMGANPAIIKDFYLATRLTGPDYPVLEERRKKQNFERIVVLIGKGFDSANEEISNLAHKYLKNKNLGENLEILNPSDFKNFIDIRESHEIIYRRDLYYYFQSEIGKEKISAELMEFIDVGQIPTKQEYIGATSQLYSWRKKINASFTKTLLVSLSASTSAPRADTAYEYDLNAAITAAGFPQLSIPAFEHKEKRNISISLSGSKGSDLEILNLGIKICSQELETTTHKSLKSYEFL